MCTGVVYQRKLVIRSRRPLASMFGRNRGIADTVAKEDVWMWIAGKQYIPQQKSPAKDKFLG